MRLPNIKNTTVRIRLQYMRLLSHLMQVEHGMNKSEEDLLEAIYNKFSLLDKYRSQVFCKQGLTTEDIKIMQQELEKHKMQYSFFMDLLMMTMADGIIEETERGILSHMAKLMAISSADFYNLLNFVQVSHQFKEDSMVDPMFDYVIESLIGWAKQPHVRIFKQTTLSLNQAIDSILKERL